MWYKNGRRCSTRGADRTERDCWTSVTQGPNTQFPHSHTQIYLSRCHARVRTSCRSDRRWVAQGETTLMRISVKGFSGCLRCNPGSKWTPFGPAHVQKLGRLLQTKNRCSTTSYTGLRQLLRSSLLQSKTRHESYWFFSPTSSFPFLTAPALAQIGEGGFASREMPVPTATSSCSWKNSTNAPSLSRDSIVPPQEAPAEFPTSVRSTEIQRWSPDSKLAYRRMSDGDI
jgi:hypothetical protein